MRLARLLSTSALFAFGTVSAFAAPADSTAPSAKKGSTKVAAAAPSMMGNTAPTDEHEEHVSVSGHHTYFDGVTRRDVGGGLMQKQDSAKSVSAISRDYIEKQAPGQDPMQLIAMLPGANVTSSDPAGLTGSHMSARGLDQSQMGFTLEGFPINDIGSFQTYSQEIVDSENLRKVSLAQGSADLDSPHLSATGGVVDMYMIDPKMKKGGAFDVSYGSYAYTRGFLRLDTGKIGQTNLRAYFSGSYATEDAVHSEATNRKLHAEAKFVNDWGDGNRVSLAIVGNRLYNYSNPSVNLPSWNTYGLGVKDQYVASCSTGKTCTRPNGTTFQNNSGATISNTVYNGVYKDYSYYKLHPNPFTNIYASAPSTFKLTDHLVLTETPYFWYGNGSGGGSTYSVPTTWGTTAMGGTLNGKTPTSGTQLFETAVTTTYRPGAVTKLTLTTGVNRLMVGYWFEYAKQIQTEPGTGIGADGTPWDILGSGPNYVFSDGTTYQYRQSLTQTRTHTMFIGDSLSLLHNKLTIDAGLKYAIVTRDGHNFLPNTSTGPYVGKSYYEPLPTASIRYQINPEMQVFVSGSTNFRIPTNNSLYDAGSFSKGVYSTQANQNQRPEISISEEAGWRYTGPTVMASVTYFHYDFTNRLLSQTQCLDSACSATVLTNINAGGQTTNGVDAEVGTRPIFYHIRPYASFEYVDARTTSNLQSSYRGLIDYMPTSGKFAPETPKYQVGFNLDYDDGNLFGAYKLKYVAKQYSTFMNDQHIPGYVKMDITVGYRFKNLGFLQAPNIKFNLTNITNNHYLGFPTGLQVNATEKTGIFGNKIGGTAPTYMIAAPFSAIGSISAGF
ncbi:TonB-dependent receptor [Gluconobacter roseus]|uniref:TonB-dependent receptor n=1 Tax=Gluconobacter roseus NBRC 3990 TaxID=1307950 RepID=A0A4Y3M637_9PROT|nr:TonB-dependent receptor [Gluconobacter roseus]KXV42654.1 TonB-dependent receptor [Gluconobacter roseus]GBR49544.1 TonB-dependent receptor [Gluconobacter roseus NBRC 3990]GEB04084.1 TonB-dependent receptor [Gluconobacter roseus NBRC 3990]GLP92529.1 TonB-dependent receptor [Gluconobacter roseus NBRC 3990]